MAMAWIPDGPAEADVRLGMGKEQRRLPNPNLEVTLLGKKGQHARLLAFAFEHARRAHSAADLP